METRISHSGEVILGNTIHGAFWVEGNKLKGCGCASTHVNVFVTSAKVDAADVFSETRGEVRVGGGRQRLLIIKAFNSEIRSAAMILLISY